MSVVSERTFVGVDRFLASPFQVAITLKARVEKKSESDWSLDLRRVYGGDVAYFIFSSPDDGVDRRQSSYAGRWNTFRFEHDAAGNEWMGIECVLALRRIEMTSEEIDRLIEWTKDSIRRSM